eukprot:jgi/Undpi1/4594/HiC_scaffold_18.g07948.m1
MGREKVSDDGMGSKVGTGGREDTISAIWDGNGGSGSAMMRWGGSDTGCPNHVNWGINPNDAQYQPTNMSIPAYPMMLEAGGSTDLSSTANAVGIMRNGVAIEQVVEYEDTAFYRESNSFDLCGGHSTGQGTYHYHSTAGCLQEQAALAAGTSAREHSPLLGWAYRTSRSTRGRVACSMWLAIRSSGRIHSKAPKVEGSSRKNQSVREHFALLEGGFSEASLDCVPDSRTLLLNSGGRARRSHGVGRIRRFSNITDRASSA